MNIELLKDFFFWGFLVNYFILLWWFVFLLFCPDWIYKMHSKMIPVSREQFNGIHYGAMAFYKLGIFLVFLGPWIALHIVS